MPNIYLRLPTSRCQFFRHRDPKLTLAKDEPVVFSNYSHEHFIMRNSLINAPARSSRIDLGCFSQQQWCNMLTGRHPAGGKVMMRRDAGRTGSVRWGGGDRYLAFFYYFRAMPFCWA